MTYVFAQKPALEDVEHHGVKGMKWGVRRARDNHGRTSGQAKRDKAMASRKGISESRARRIRTSRRNAAVKGAKIAGGMVVYVVARDSLRSINTIRSSQGEAYYPGSAVTKIVLATGRVAFKTARASARGARVLFEKDMMVFAPGTIPQGTYPSAAIIRDMLPEATKMLNR